MERSSFHESVVHSLPSLAACFDVALNPSIPPLVRWHAQAWEDLYPPARFIRALNAVSEIGLLDKFPGELTESSSSLKYESYRSEILRAANMAYPRFSDFTTLLPIKGSLLTGETEMPSFLNDMIPFDYILWAARVAGRIRNEHPLAFAMPPLLFNRLMPELLATRDDIALSSPLYRAGNMMGSHQLLDMTVSAKLLFEVSLSWALDKISFNEPDADLFEILPDVDEDILQGVRGLVDLYVNPLPLGARVRASRLEESSSHRESESEDPLSLELRTSLIRIFNVPRKDIETRSIQALLSELEDRRTTGLRHLRSIGFEIAGYEYDPRELYEIPTVMHYCTRLQDAAPYWPFYFYLDSKSEDCFSALLLAMAGCQSHGTMEAWLAHAHVHVLLEGYSGDGNVMRSLSCPAAWHHKKMARSRKD